MSRASGRRGGDRRRPTAPLRVVPEPQDSIPGREALARDSAVAAPPRLILRFAVYTAIGLAFAAGAILLFVRSYVTSQSENSVRYHARFVAEVALGDRLQASDPDAGSGSIGSSTAACSSTARCGPRFTRRTAA
jgi:hypothetical protein